MSTLAKVFVIINLVLSIVFISMAGTMFHHQRDWREAFVILERANRNRVQGYERLLEAAKGEQQALQEFSRSKEEEIRLKDTHLEQLRNDVVRLTEGLGLKRQEFQLLLAEHKKVVDQIDVKDNRINELSTEKDRLAQEREVALNDKETAETQVARLTRIKNDLEGDLADLRKSYHDAEMKRDDLQGRIEQLIEAGVNVHSLAAGEPVPTIEGTVTAVDKELGLMILSVGSDDKVEMGYEFTVYRGERYVGKVVVERVLSDMCGARVTHLDKGAEIQAGDSATTRPGF